MPQLPSLLSDLSARLGVAPLDLDDGTQLTLLFDEITRITIDYDPEDKAVIFSGVVGDSDLCRGVDAYRWLLSSSVLGAATGGAAFGLNADTGEIVLWKRYSDSFEDAADIEKELGSFLGTLEYLLRILPQTLPGTNGDTDLQSGRDVVAGGWESGIRV